MKTRCDEPVRQKVLLNYCRATSDPSGCATGDEMGSGQAYFPFQTAENDGPMCQLNRTLRLAAHFKGS